jgi:hypothetical protein
MGKSSKDEKKTSSRNSNPKSRNQGFDLLYMLNRRDSIQDDKKKIFLFQVLFWIENALEINSLKKYGMLSIENILTTNEKLLDLCIHQCFNCNPYISEAYFTSILNVFEKFDIECDVHKIISLILYMSISKTNSMRVKSFRLLFIISQRFFNKEVRDYSYFVSSDLNESYLDTQYELSSKLSFDFREFSNDVVSDILYHFEYMSEYSQKYMIKSMEPWLEFVQFKKNNETEILITKLYSISFLYSDVHSTECKNIWIMLSREITNIPLIIKQLIKLNLSLKKNETIKNTQVTQKIIRYLSQINIKIVLKVIVKYIMKLITDSLINNNINSMTESVSKISITSEDVEDEQNIFNEQDIILLLLGGITYEQKEEIINILPILLQFIMMYIDDERKQFQEVSKNLFITLIDRLVYKYFIINSNNIEINEHLYKTKSFIEDLR